MKLITGYIEISILNGGVSSAVKELTKKSEIDRHVKSMSVTKLLEDTIIYSQYSDPDYITFTAEYLDTVEIDSLATTKIVKDMKKELMTTYKNWLASVTENEKDMWN